MESSCQKSRSFFWLRVSAKRVFAEINPFLPRSQHATALSAPPGGAAPHRRDQSLPAQTLETPMATTTSIIAT